MQQEINPAPTVLASILSSYPDENFQEALATFLEDEAVQLPESLRENLLRLSQSDSYLDDLRSDYIAIFDQSKALNPLYETEYGRERAMFKANELADIAGFYRAFGFEMDNDEGCREMVDHISVELEFYSLMQMKYIHLAELNDHQGCEIVLDGMKKFMQSHLGRFTSTIVQRPGVLDNPMYLSIFQWIDQMVDDECKRLGAMPDKVSWIASQVEEENICCGGTVAINK